MMEEGHTGAENHRNEGRRTDMRRENNIHEGRRTDRRRERNKGGKKDRQEQRTT